LAPEEKLLTEQQVAEMLSVSAGAVRKWRGQGRIASINLGTAVRYRYIDVMAFIEAGRTVPLCSSCAKSLSA
jgi:excisionase family DNA binding protein